jgi:flavin reductase (DIM6/NTAB) family NADH-FMN oxidoreductase RutF
MITGSHHMFVGKVEYVHAAQDMVKENGDLDFSTMKFL